MTTVTPLTVGAGVPLRRGLPRATYVASLKTHAVLCRQAPQPRASSFRVEPLDHYFVRQNDSIQRNTKSKNALTCETPGRRSKRQPLVGHRTQRLQKKFFRCICCAPWLGSFLDVGCPIRFGVGLLQTNRSCSTANDAEPSGACRSHIECSRCVPCPACGRPVRCALDGSCRFRRHRGIARSLGGVTSILELVICRGE